MKNIAFLSLITLLSFNSFGQRDSIRNEILNYSDSNPEIISKGRGLLLEKFMEGDYKKVKEIKDYLINKFQNKDYVIFYPMEYWLISYWTQQYNELLTNLRNIDMNRTRFNGKIAPPNDLLFEKLLNKSRDSILQLETFINNTQMKPVEKDFLILHLKYITKNETYQQKSNDSLNILADKFLSSYPKSDYENFTRKYIRYKLVPSKWAFTAEFFSGYGIFTGDLKNVYQNNIPIGVAFDIYYKKFALYLRDYIGFSKLKTDIPYDNGVWEKGSQVRVFLPEASLGYVVLDNNIFKIAPFAGISSTDITPTQYDLNQQPDLEKTELKFTTTYTAGLNADIKLGRSKIPMVSFGPEQNYWFLRIRYAYNMPQFAKKYIGFNGNMHYITIGVGGFGRKIKRDY